MATMPQLNVTVGDITFSVHGSFANLHEAAWLIGNGALVADSCSVSVVYKGAYANYYGDNSRGLSKAIKVLLDSVEYQASKES